MCPTLSSVNDLIEHPEGTSLGELEIDRLLTVPNLLTTLRLLCIPLFVYLLLDARPEDGLASRSACWCRPTGSTAMPPVASISSTFGKMYDPTVDRLVMVVAITSIIIDGSAPGWFAWTIITREVLVSIFVVVITAMGAKRMNVTWWGKVGTFANMAAFPWFLFLRHEPSFSEPIRTFWDVRGPFSGNTRGRFPAFWPHCSTFRSASWRWPRVGQNGRPRCDGGSRWCR